VCCEKEVCIPTMVLKFVVSFFLQTLIVFKRALTLPTTSRLAIIKYIISQPYYLIILWHGIKKLTKTN
jgi:hypothetical protein